MTALIIDHDYSYCGDCNVSVDPHEKYHDTTYTPRGKRPGCGAEYTELGSHVWSLTPDFIIAVRAFHPALPFIGTIQSERTVIQ